MAEETDFLMSMMEAGRPAPGAPAPDPYEKKVYGYEQTAGKMPTPEMLKGWGHDKMEDAASWGDIRGVDNTSPAFRRKASIVAEELGMSPKDLMAIMSFETQGSFDASKRNDIGATGLLQFTRRTAKGLGTTTDKLSKMSPERQLDFVRKYLEPYKGRLGSLEDAYLSVLLPSKMGSKPTDVVMSKGRLGYAGNAYLDKNKDKKITMQEIMRAMRGYTRHEI